jgi:hypothetical protein
VLLLGPSLVPKSGFAPCLDLCLGLRLGMRTMGSGLRFAAHVATFLAS